MSLPVRSLPRAVFCPRRVCPTIPGATPKQRSTMNLDDYPALDVIAVGAHPDDAEIACGGTLARLAQQGYRVGIIDLTDGEPTPHSPGPHVRLAEAQQAAETSGRAPARHAGSAEPPAVRHVRGPRAAGQGVPQVPAAGGDRLRRQDAAWRRPITGRRCRSPTRPCSTPG